MIVYLRIKKCFFYQIDKIFSQLLIRLFYFVNLPRRAIHKTFPIEARLLQKRENFPEMNQNSRRLSQLTAAAPIQVSITYQPIQYVHDTLHLAHIALIDIHIHWCRNVNSDKRLFCCVLLARVYLSISQSVFAERRIRKIKFLKRFGKKLIFIKTN